MAPRSTASAAWTCPSLTRPGTQQKRSPGTTRRLSCAMPLDLDRGGVADGLDHLYVVEEEVHGHAWHGRTDSVACPGHPCETAATGVMARVT